MITEIKSFLKKYSDKYLIGVSGGVDSMTLLDILIKLFPKKIIVCHVNYNLRPESPQEAKYIKTFCDKKKIPCYILEVKKPLSGNIQGRAREIRFDYFLKIAHKLQIKNILLGHNLDDHLETYLLQKERNIITQHFGIKPEIIIKKCLFLRPLLNIYKTKIIDYAIKNQVRYFEDSSNSKLVYKRNKIRHNYLKKLTIIEKNNLINEIIIKNQKNQKKFKKIAIIYRKIIRKDKFHKSLFLEDPEIIFMILYNFLQTQNYPIKKIKKGVINEIVSFHYKTINNKVEINLYQNYTIKKDGDWYHFRK